MKRIRESKFSRVVAWYLLIMIFLEATSSLGVYALTSGPTQPEFNAFTPIGTSDMVDLTSGDFNYNIPIMDVGGYPINLAYNSGVTMDQEASWVGLGWNLNVGQIERQIRGIPDDFNGDEIGYHNNLKKNQTVGFNFRVNGQLVGLEGLGLNTALSLQHNNYTGVSATPTFGVSYSISENVSVGMSLTSSATEGATVNPRVSLSGHVDKNEDSENGFSSSIGLSYNSRQGLQSINLSASSKKLANDTRGTMGNGSATFNFVNNTFTPTIRNEFSSRSGTANFSLGGHVYSFDIEGGVGGFFSVQKLKNPHSNEKSYGYEYSENATADDQLDFNRENDRSISKNTKALATTNYTYDVYNMQTQGMSGSFRPYQSQVGFVFDANKKDDSNSGSLGLEVEFGTGVHLGTDVEYSKSDVRAGTWSTPVNTYFRSSGTEKIDYEKNYYKLSSDLTLDDEMGLYTSKLGSNKAIDLKLYNINDLDSHYRIKNGSNNYSALPINQKIKRNAREKRSQVIQKITKKEASGDINIAVNTNAKDHHTAGIKALNNDGTTYVFGETVYNKTKNEVSFALNKNTMPDDNGIASYTNSEASVDNRNGIDHYYNMINTPAYASTYLLTSVLSVDYEDITGNGVSDDDLGSYTKFSYKAYGDYKWRAPYYGASYNPGFNSDKNHKRASYTYGKKESKYISKIETKTHVAFFELSPRKDGYGVNDEHNQNKNFTSTSVMYKIDKIKLYSKPEAKKANLLDNDASNDLPIAPIKTAHFVYSYDLCKAIHNNNGSQQLSVNEESNNGGKLTLKKVYFTYRNSNMGKYTPYVFNYDEDNDVSNPDYNMKSFDVWGNFKANPSQGIANGSMLPTAQITSIEFPYVEQDKVEADKNTAAWHLKKIKLPSGGEINIETESDDYQFVQNKRAMQMFKVVGVRNSDENTIENDPTKLFRAGSYGSSNEAKYLMVKIGDDGPMPTQESFLRNYIGDHIDKPIFFRFMLNMLNTGPNNYDYVEGYFKIDRNENFLIDSASRTVGIPMQLTDMEGGVNGGKNVNPISKAGWYFGRQNMNKTVYGLNNDPDSENVMDVINAIGSSLQPLMEIFTGPNGRLRNNKQCAQKFIPEKSWIRLQNPNQKKLGGGCRVKSVKLSDKWGDMLSGNMNNTGSNLQNMEYGQVYDYTLDVMGTSSGVATFEPLGAKDNYFIEPVYDKGERLVAPKEVSYVEKPLGISFFPSPAVTYSKVTVKNLPRVIDETKVVKKHATGAVVSEFYTYKDFPVKADFTELKKGENFLETAPSPVVGFLATMLGVPVIDNTKVTMSQGFVIETNDMNGKQKSQKVYDENKNLISAVEYKYNVDGENLENNLPVIYPDGTVSKSLVGVNYDVINDLRKNYAKSEVYGIRANASIDITPSPPFVLVLGMVVPSMASHTQELRTAATTKVVHKKGILIEKIAFDLGAVVSTKNLLWDANSGQVLLTETINEYNDKYYSFTYPAYWKYDGMGLASSNIGLEGTLTASSNPTNPTSNSDATTDPYFKISGYPDLSKIFHLGDQLYIPSLTIASGSMLEMDDLLELEENENSIPITGTQLWVVGFNHNKDGVLLMKRNGNYINKCLDYTNFDFKIVRSGYRNLQSASMASITLMRNPIKIVNVLNHTGYLDQDILFYNNLSSFNPRVVNASAVVYKDFWRPQAEMQLPYYPDYPHTNVSSTEPLDSKGNPKYPYALQVNPYVWNIKGDWRAEKSYAYLTGRNASDGQFNNPRNEGFYTNFSPFYLLINGIWEADDAGWTSASSITRYSPFGAELENEDALHRYSAAQFGYNFTLPMAVGSNSRYAQMGFEGFEESLNPGGLKHFEFNITEDNLSTAQSHTGKKSIKIVSGNQIKLKANLKTITPTYQKELCPIAPNQGTGGGTACFINRSANEIIFDNPISISGQCSSHGTGGSGATAAVVGNKIIVYTGPLFETLYIKVVSAEQVIYLSVSISGSAAGPVVHGVTCDFTPPIFSCFN